MRQGVSQVWTRNAILWIEILLQNRERKYTNDNKEEIEIEIGTIIREPARNGTVADA